jgi:DNA-binding MarR family transcriptional regulator
MNPFSAGDAGPGNTMARKRFDSPEQEAYLHLWRTYDRLRAVEDALFGRYDLSAQQYNALRLLRAAHPQPCPTLALGARLISRAPDMTRLLDRLEARGLVTRNRRSENRRVVEVELTPAGLALLDELAPLVKACHEQQLGHLPPTDLARLVELLDAARSPHESPAEPWP